MANQTVRGRTGAGSGTSRQRSVAAAARAAAKRAGRAQQRAVTAPDAAEEATEGVSTQEPPEDATVDAGKVAPKAATGSKVATGSESAAEDTAGTATGDSKDAAATDEAGGPARRRRSGLLCAALTVLLVVGLVAATLLGLEYRDAERTREARTEALAAARKAAPVILSYDYRHLDRDFSAARAHLTGGFHDKYKKTTSTVVGPTAKKYHGVVKATVAKPPSGGAPAASVVSASPGKAEILLFINQVTKSTQISGPRVDLNRVRMTMTRTEDGWKVSAVDAL